MIKGIHDRPSLFYLNHKKATRSTSLNKKKKKNEIKENSLTFALKKTENV